MIIIHSYGLTRLPCSVNHTPNLYCLQLALEHLYLYRWTVLWQHHCPQTDHVPQAQPHVLTLLSSEVSGLVQIPHQFY